MRAGGGVLAVPLFCVLGSARRSSGRGQTLTLDADQAAGWAVDGRGSRTGSDIVRGSGSVSQRGIAERGSESGTGRKARRGSKSRSGSTSGSGCRAGVGVSSWSLLHDLVCL